MDVTRRFVEKDQLTSIVGAVFGSARRLNTVERLSGGSKKGVYRLTFDDEFTAILYVWNEEENYWPTTQGHAGSGQADPLSDASGSDLFEASHACLNAIGVRTPQVYFFDRSRSHFPADVAVVEDVRGGTLEARLDHDPRSAEPTLVRLSAALQAMRQQRGRRPGKVALVEGLADVQQERSCEQIVLDRAVRDLAEAATRVERLAQVREQLEEKIHELASAVCPRHEYSLIHGELGPDHVLVDEQGNPVIIDIEGTMFFDVEWEHVFLQLRFGEHYRWLQANDLDEQRLQFYALAMYLSLVAGPLRLLDGDFPNREGMMGIAQANIQHTLTFLQRNA
ncbi:phosphotransferase family protein [Dictyobacter formicarum]|uniref:Aminoglycoside phosphotransferase n=1 Tax=Dictyobacter formicarum TaxID=2778368 RepID=A0ABQ3VH04_9CHLR|nr:phosphotransferase [Dictyobacter formicarum]GHO85065.1 aminoglycoside phosphotransferase [Dictyobacter formicarum]